MGEVTSLQSAIGQGESMALVDLHALLHPELRRSGDAEHVGLDDEHATAAADSRDSEVPRRHESLATLATIDARLVQVVEMRNFCGRTGPEIAEALGFAVRTVTRDWEKARLFPACLFALSPCKVNAELIQN